MRKKILISLIALIQLTVSFATLPVVDTKKDTTSSYASKTDEAMVKNAVVAFKNLSKKERKARMADVKTMLKNYKADKIAGTGSTDTLLLAILAILLPPLAVYLHENDFNAKFWISLLLTLLFWLPGVIYALIVVLA